MLKYVRRNKLGYVSVKLFIFFKKVKYFIWDWRIIVYVLKYLVVFELNEDYWKVRRIIFVLLFFNENFFSKMFLVYDFYLFFKLWVLVIF